MLADVAKLREFVTQRLEALKTAQKTPEKTKEEPGFFSRNANAFKIAGIISLALIGGAALGVGLALGGIFVLPIAVNAIAVEQPPNSPRFKER